MNKKYIVDPCQACQKSYDIDDINSINQCCYDTLASFEGASSINWFRDGSEARNCSRCVQESIRKLGRDPCEFKPEPAPVWTQVPSYFPKFLEETGDVSTARDKCFTACKSNRYPNECIKRCKIDADAVKMVETYEMLTVQSIIENDYVKIPLIILSVFVGIFLISKLVTVISSRK